MTDYPVQCYNNNGEPYGRYCNPFEEYTGIKPFESLNGRWEIFEDFAESNSFPMPGAEIGKTYDRDQVEVVWQMCERDEDSAFSFDWVDDEFGMHRKYSNDFPDDYRQIFRLISKTETTQPVEKEPETVDRLTCSCGKEGIKGVDVGQPFAPYSDRVICKTCWNKFQDWQKKQEASNG